MVPFIPIHRWLNGCSKHKNAELRPIANFSDRIIARKEGRLVWQPTSHPCSHRPSCSLDSIAFDLDVAVFMLFARTWARASLSKSYSLCAARSFCSGHLQFPFYNVESLIPKFSLLLTCSCKDVGLRWCCIGCKLEYCVDQLLYRLPGPCCECSSCRIEYHNHDSSSRKYVLIPTMMHKHGNFAPATMTSAPSNVNFTSFMQTVLNKFYRSTVLTVHPYGVW
jgi:hypothetical protein